MRSSIASEATDIVVAISSSRTGRAALADGLAKRVGGTDQFECRRRISTQRGENADVLEQERQRPGIVVMRNARRLSA